MAARVVLYELPMVPFGSEVVVIESAATTVMLRGCVAVCAVGVLESVAFAVNDVLTPLAVGVPVIAPVLAFSVAQLGRAVPAAMLHVTGGLPPALCKVVL